MSKRIAVVAALGVLSFAPASARADERERCASAAEQAQQLRDDGKYRRAREQMLSCARDVCPGPIRSDCGKWLTEIDRDAPTVVFGARDNKGEDVLDVKVSMDGVLVLQRLDGKPVIVDSGEHTFKFETKDGKVKEEKVLVRAAEKARPIVATFATEGGPAEPNKPAQTPSGEQPPAAQKSIVPPLVLAGVGVVGLGLFTVFALSGKSKLNDLDGCKPNCNQSDVDSAKTTFLIGDISLGVGVVALGVATYLYLTRSNGDAKVQTGSNWRFEAGPVAGGAVGAVGAKF